MRPGEEAARHEERGCPRGERGNVTSELPQPGGPRHVCAHGDVEQRKPDEINDVDDARRDHGGGEEAAECEARRPQYGRLRPHEREGVGADHVGQHAALLVVPAMGAEVHLRADQGDVTDSRGRDAKPSPAKHVEEHSAAEEERRVEHERRGAGVEDRR